MRLPRPVPTTDHLLLRMLRAHATLGRRAAVWTLLSPLLWLAQAWLLAAAVAWLAGQSGIEPVRAAAGFALLALLRAFSEARAAALSQGLARTLRSQLRESLIAHALRRRGGGVEEDPGGLASLMGEAITQTGPWVERYLPARLRARVLPLVVLLLVLTQSWAAALALLLTGPLIPLFMALVGWAAEAASRAHLVETGALNRALIDRVAALVDLRLLDARARAAVALHAHSEQLRKQTMHVLRLAFLSSAVLEFFASLGVALVAVHVGLSLLGLIGWGQWDAALGVQAGVFILLIAADFYQPLRDLAAAWHDRAAADAAAIEIDRWLATERILGNGEPAAPVAPGILSWRGLVLAPGAGASIAVPDGSIEPGAAIALTGASGAGKTTLLLTLCGLLPSAAGQISLGTQQLDADSADAIRMQLALLPQAPRFPSGSLRQFLVGRRAPANQALADALAAAQASALLARLPQGLATQLGESGGGVSGGEARRLLIARALLDPPAVLLADEPTADLDHHAAAKVIDALLALRQRGTALLVATHDPVLVARLDRCIALDART